MSANSNAIKIGEKIIYSDSGTDAVLTVKAQTAVNTKGHDMYYFGGDGNGTGIGGNFMIQAGSGTNGGHSYLMGGVPTAGAGGDVYFEATDAVGGNNNGGNAKFYAGRKSGSGVNGQFQFYPYGGFGGGIGILDFDLLGSTNRTYTFPDASGTIALTSSLSGYVPYTSATTDLDLNAKSFKNFFISKTADVTAKFAFDVSALSTATTRTLTVPNRSLTLDNITTSTTSNGTGFVKANGTSITFDNSTYLTSAVTSIATAGLISGGTITSTGTITTSMATGKLVGRGTAGTGVMEEITIGSGLTLTGTTLSASGGGSSAISGLTAASATNTIDNTNYAQEWQWSTLAGASALKLSSTSTAAASNTQKLFELALSGANGTSSQTTYAQYVTNTHTGTSSTNVAGYFSASGGTTNYALHARTQVTSTSAVAPVMIINADSTGTTSAGFGGSLAFRARLNTTSDSDLGNISYEVDGTGFGGSGKLKFNVLRNGAVNTYLTISGNGSGTSQFAGVINVDGMASNFSRFGYDSNNYMKLSSTSSAQITFDVQNNTGTPSYNFANANFGIGTGTTVSAKLHVIKTTEQIRSGYDASNYMSITTGSTGSTTFALTGTNAEFTFSQKTNFTGAVVLGNTITLKAYTVATLPIAPAVGMECYVTDALAPAMGATVAGGGAAYAKVWYNNANWTVTGV
ncbi:MAG: hypothetical protein ACR2IQ_02650 [Minisyncoccia bacterium]